jgi:putative transposase
VRYAWIRQHQRDYPVQVLCRVLAVSDSGYYDWRDRPPSARRQRHQRIAQAAARSYFESHRIYGYRKVHQDLQAEGVPCGEDTVRQVLRENGLYSRVKRKFVTTTDSNHSKPIADNLLERDFSAERPNEKWVADITYLATAEGWLYLAAVMDLFSRRIVGWSMSESIDAALVSAALKMAVEQRGPDAGLLHHSDRGVQYASGDYQAILQECQIVGSMSRKGNCWDNAVMENFFGSLKNEWVRDQVFPTRSAAQESLFNYIEVFYNRQRRHASLGYLSPAAYEEQYERSRHRAA